jgi:hypothetical protein
MFEEDGWTNCFFDAFRQPRNCLLEGITRSKALGREEFYTWVFAPRLPVLKAEKFETAKLSGCGVANYSTEEGIHSQLQIRSYGRIFFSRLERMVDGHTISHRRAAEAATVVTGIVLFIFVDTQSEPSFHSNNPL